MGLALFEDINVSLLYNKFMYDFGPILEFIILLNITPFILLGLLIFINRPSQKKAGKKEETTRKVISLVLALLILVTVVYIISSGLFIFRWL